MFRNDAAHDAAKDGDFFCDPDQGGLARASFDLECPVAGIQVLELGGNSVGATGCGKRAVYTFVVHVGWVKNSDTERHARDETAPEPR